MCILELKTSQSCRLTSCKDGWLKGRPGSLKQEERLVGLCCSVLPVITEMPYLNVIWKINLWIKIPAYLDTSIMMAPVILDFAPSPVELKQRDTDLSAPEEGTLLRSSSCLQGSQRPRPRQFTMTGALSKHWLCLALILLVISSNSGDVFIQLLRCSLSSPVQTQHCHHLVFIS